MKVLYATDGFPAAESARRVMMRLFRREDARVTVATVTHSHSLLPEHLLVELEPIAERRGESEEIVRFAQEELETAGFRTDTVVLEGHPGEEIIRLATQGRYGLVLVGAGSHSWLGNRVLGSVSTFVLHEARCSVMIVHEELGERPTGRVLVGVDGSRTSKENVATLARILDPARCEIEVCSTVHAQIPTLAPIPVGAPPLDAESFSRQDAVATSMAEGHVRSAETIFRRAGFSTSSRIQHGAPASSILQEALETRADLVAVGSRGLGPLRRTFLGSVSDQVARHAAATFVGRFWMEHH